MKAPGCDLYLQGCHFLAASELDKVISLLQLMFTFLVDELTQVKQMQTLKVLEELPSGSLRSFLAQSRRPRCLMLLHRSPVLCRDLGCSDGLKTQNQTPEVQHHIISSEKCWCKLLSSAFKIRVHLKPAGFAAWVSRFIGCLLSERKITAKS